jgi:tetratricopeptide (TPR) repeat protein
MIFLSYYLFPRINKRGYLKAIRTVCCLYAGALIILLIVTLLKSSRFLDSTLYHDPISAQKVFWMVFDWLTVILFVFIFFKYWLYFIRHDQKIITIGWYLNKHSDLLKNKDYNTAYGCLQKANQLSPDSVFIWCVMASFNEHFFNRPDECDQCLAKAKQILDTSTLPSLKDQAGFEHYSGYILQHREQIQDAIEHFKKAYNLDPTPYRKKVYEEAIEKVNTNSSKLM